MAERCARSRGRLRWIVVPPVMTMDKALEELRWALADGEKLATPLDYAPLPSQVQERVLKTIDTLTVNGTKVSAK